MSLRFAAFCGPPIQAGSRRVAIVRSSAVYVKHPLCCGRSLHQQRPIVARGITTLPKLSCATQVRPLPEPRVSVSLRITAKSFPPAMSTLPLGSSVAVAWSRAWFIVGVEPSGAKLPPGAGVGVGIGVGVGTGVAKGGEDESPPHPAIVQDQGQRQRSRSAAPDGSQRMRFRPTRPSHHAPPHSSRDIAALLFAPQSFALARAPIGRRRFLHLGWWRHGLAHLARRRLAFAPDRLARSHDASKY